MIFRIESVGKPGLLNVPVTIIAEEAIAMEKRRIRYSWLHVARIETWRITIDAGERLEVKLPSSAGPKAGDRLTLAALGSVYAIKQRWRKIAEF